MGIGGGTKSEDYSGEVSSQKQDQTSVGADESYVALDGGLAAQMVQQADIETNQTQIDVSVGGGKYVRTETNNLGQGAIQIGEIGRDSEFQINMLDGNAIEDAFLFASQVAKSNAQSVDALLTSSEENIDRFTDAYEDIYNAAYESARIDKSDLSPYMPVLLLGAGFAAYAMYLRYRKKGKK